MDADGTSSKGIARSLRKLGVKASISKSLLSFYKHLGSLKQEKEKWITVILYVFWSGHDWNFVEVVKMVKLDVY